MRKLNAVKIQIAGPGPDSTSVFSMSTTRVPLGVQNVNLGSISMSYFSKFKYTFGSPGLFSFVHTGMNKVFHMKEIEWKCKGMSKNEAMYRKLERDIEEYAKCEANTMEHEGELKE